MADLYWAGGIIVTVNLTIASIVFAWVKSLQSEVDRMTRSLPLDYVPRTQVDARFMELNRNLHSHMNGMESRSGERFDKLDLALQRIHDKLDTKMDKG